MPRYPGGNVAFKTFVAENLRYPNEALALNHEGSVIVEYDVHDSGKVSNPHIIKGLGHGCDEEAIRLVSLLRFEKVKNRGVRVKMTTKTTIHFKLPAGMRINYAPAPPEEKASSKDGDQKKTDPVKYNYTISF